MIEEGADECQDGQHATLFTGAMKMDIWRSRELIKAGADVNAKSNDSANATPLHWSARYGHLEVVRALIQAGADVKAEIDDGSTPLHMSAPNLEVVRYLIEAGADVNAKRNDGWTPLHQSASYGHREVVQALIEEG